MSPELPDVMAVKAYFLELQTQIVENLEALDGHRFERDPWEKAPGQVLSGTGMSQIIEDGHFFERGGVNFSHVRGAMLPASASAHRPELAGRAFEALGLSLVLHPRNPYVPTVHMNVRFFVAHATHALDAWWIGGGMDLTPYYGFDDDAIHFHRCCRESLEPYGSDLYPRFKKWCDDYFYLKHRQEPRGIGGIFFDDFNELEFDRALAMLRSLGAGFSQAYLPIAERRGQMPYGQQERDWQAYRRGRYVEFNLICDRGTLFGLQSGGRTESILMSLPPVVRWRYNYQPPPSSPEAELMSRFLVAKAWI